MFLEFLEKVKQNKDLAILFVISTFFLLFQHSIDLSWDFSSYVLNAKYLFYDGSYFEILRAPLVPAILGLFLFLGKSTEVIFILFTAILFLVGNVALSDALFKDREIKKEAARFIFYFFSMSSYVLYFGTLVGTELLGLAFLELFLAFYIRNKISGHFLALGILARYNLGVFFPLLFINTDYKKILKNIGLVVLIVFPWLLFNFLSYGNWLASPIDSYTLNVLNRDYLWEPFTITPVLKIIGWFFPFLALGLIISIKEIIKKKELKIRNILMWGVGLLILYDFIATPQKKVRFLFNLSLPVAYFSSLGLFFILNKLKHRFKKIGRLTLSVLSIIFIITSLVLINAYILNPSVQNKTFKNAAEDIKDLGLEDCAIFSPQWVSVTYYTENVYPLYDKPFRELANQNKTLLIFKNLGSIDYSTRDLAQFEDLIFFETVEYAFLSQDIERCSKKYVHDKSYSNNEFCENFARKFEGVGMNETFKKTCYVFNKN